MVKNMLVSTLTKGFNILKCYRTTENKFSRNLFDINAAKYTTITHNSNLSKSKTN